MIQTIYYSLAIIAYSIFLIQFILTLFGALDLDMDIDVDGDGATDLSWGDVISFKGLIHFLMGSAGWLSVKSITAGTVYWYDYLIALFMGVFFFLVLFWLYKLMLKLENKPKVLSGQDLVGTKATVYFVREPKSSKSKGYHEYQLMLNNGVGVIECVALSAEEHSIGESVVITDYINGNYIF